METISSLKDVTRLRQEIHRMPELSGDEGQTAQKIADFVTQFKPDNLLKDLGGHGLVAQFKGESKGPAVTLRAELDGLPILETGARTYRSEVVNRAHACGHDGHMAMVAAVARFLATNRPKKGVVNLLFQPAEETGEGARAMLDDKAFHAISHDYVFALHNLPGYSKQSIVIRPGTFAAASLGLIISLTGKTSHAAEPENGINPDLAVAEIIQFARTVPQRLQEDLDGFALATLIHVAIGERAFGTAAGNAEILLTLRAFNDKDLIRLKEAVVDHARAVSKGNRLEINVSETEVFNATVNDPECINIIKNAAKEHHFDCLEQEQPFKWSEDFGLFTQQFKGAMFGLGAGEDTPALHNPDYDFPDDIAPAGVNMFISILKQLVY